MTDTIVVGAGLFGQIITAELRRQGQQVLMLDRREPLAGSGPAACLMKPSWFSGLGRAVYEPALETLDHLYHLRDLTFDVHVGKSGKIAQARVHWVDPRDVLDKEFRHCSVLQVAAGRVVLSTGETLEARNIIVAAGVWTETLLRQYAQGWQRGMAALYPGARPEGRGVIKAWAPYRQLVGFDRLDGLWVGDGSAIKHANWTQGREEEILARETKLARRLVGSSPLPQPRLLQGLRPYWKGAGPCLLERVEEGLWVASGGAKNGTLSAGWAAWRLARELT
jgi:glycine/D-amino acid oxidase-like deaminating enzyme